MKYCLHHTSISCFSCKSKNGWRKFEFFRYVKVRTVYTHTFLKALWNVRICLLANILEFFKPPLYFNVQCAHMVLFENSNRSDQPPAVFFYLFKKGGKNVAIVRYIRKIPQSLTPTIDIIMQKRHSTTEMATPAKAPSATMIIFALIFANVIVFRNDCQLPHLNSIVVRDKPTILFPINQLIFSKKSFFLSPVSKCDAREGERSHWARHCSSRLTSKCE